ncbi:hypothetical protein KTQ42_23630 [Noviherbaspirillum sp. L7-7A]|uniref:hypothetical protein n=1 Tax=Noviherbaspirillum sp. L7-7A TaxID=2850560 RepID=UPI001C2C6599|nr:hypothetical protein [Noviherbaspirillum sp. L7-7A]MBV0882271.1 hypothetical protein [Noviherbaspirillum sp. L7-7A]
MTEKLGEQTDLITLDRQIDELNQRISSLKERMAAMASQKYETTNQSILLTTMQEVLKDLHLLRLEILGVSGSRHDYPEAAYQSDAHRDMIPAMRRKEEQLGAR